MHLAVVSLHTSPLAQPGQGDAGGMNVVVAEQMRAFAQLGHTVDIFTRRADPNLPDAIEMADGVLVHHLTAGPTEPIAKSAMDDAIEPFRDRLRDAMAALESCDLIHSHHWFSGVAALPVARELGIPHVQSFHSVAAPDESDSLAAGEPAESSGRIAGERLVAGESDLVIAVSHAEAATIVERYEVNPDRCMVAHPGVDTDLFRPGPDDRPMHLLLAARLQPLKGPDLALETLGALPRELDARLIVAGEASEDFAHYVDELRALADELGIRDRIIAVGSLNRDELAERLRESVALLLPSWSETFGLVALEAQACGTPVVAWCGAAGVRESVGPGSVLLKSRDPQEWADAVGTLVGNRDRWVSASRQARRFAEFRTWHTTAAQLTTCYERVLA